MYKREARIRVFEYFRAFKDVPQRTSVRPCCKVSVFRDHMTSCFLLWCIYLVLYVSLKNVCVCRLQTSRSPLLNTFFHAICISLFFHAKLSTFFSFVIIQFKANPMTSSQGYIFFSTVNGRVFFSTSIVVTIRSFFLFFMDIYWSKWMIPKLVKPV